MVTTHNTKATALKFLPKGWKKIEGATTAPHGYYWANNGKSRFSKDYKQALVYDKKYWDRWDKEIKKEEKERKLKEQRMTPLEKAYREYYGAKTKDSKEKAEQKIYKLLGTQKTKRKTTARRRY